MGNVLQAGQGQAPARQAALAADVPSSTGCITVHKVCGSGMRAVMDAANSLRAGEFDVAVAGGMESMSNAPYLIPKGRSGLRMGHGQVLDSMISDGLWDPYKNVHMGNCAELCAAKYSFTREAQDAFAFESYQRARRANEAGDFNAEFAPVTIEAKKGPVTVDRDEEPFATPLEKLEKMGTLKPAFQKDGTVTAANSSKINDGASALVLVSEAALGNGKPIARIVAQASHAQEPEWFTTAPVAAARKAAEKAGIPLSQIELFEVNEAFAVVAMAFIEDLSLDPNKVNVNGGAVALGHPIGSSGSRILTTLIHALRARKKKYGLASICIGGGEATAVVVEAL
jgi:acetyl-CoA C-acetyltransferase